ncbi:putative glucan 1,3-beta-glucosidase [Helianthus debilis subsp. tardiflorus]
MFLIDDLMIDYGFARYGWDDKKKSMVCRDPRWGRCFESFSENPNIIREMIEIIPGLQGEIPINGRKGIAASAKHFVGDDGTTRGINENDTVIDFHGLLSIHMPPYYDAVRKGVATIMGFVISDFQGIDKMTDPPHVNYTWFIQESVGAGIDMVMVGYNYFEFIDGLTYLVNNNYIPGHRDLAREAVRKYLVLLKNRKSIDQPMLPLPKKSTKILATGTHVDNIGNWLDH